MAGLDTREVADRQPPRPAPDRRTAPGSVPPPVREEAARVRELRRMKRRATGVLVAMTAVFVVVTVFGRDRGWTGYLRALAEASMVGGLADWFAVTALFRHPLGVPIPHTAVIVARKEQFGQTLGAFVQENFLNPDVIAERVRASHLADRVAAWLSDRDNAQALAGYGADILVGLADSVRDQDVHRLLEEEVSRGMRAVPLAPLAGRALRLMTAQDRHQELFDAVLRALGRFLEENREMLRQRFGESSPWWLPDAVDARIFDRLFEGISDLLRDVNADAHHEVRSQLNASLAELVERLEESPELHDRAEQLKHQLLGQEELAGWSSAVWSEVKATLRSQAQDPDSELRSRVADLVAAAGRRLREDRVLSEKLEEAAESGVRYVAEHFHEEIASLISGTIARWDATETSRKLEILLGRDLQFIRINGTVVGGLAGLAIHGIAQAIG